MSDAIVVPERLRFTFFVLVSYRTQIQDGVANVIGMKEPLELSMAEIEELADMGLFRLRPHSTIPGRVMVSKVYTETEVREAFTATFTENPLPEHPSFWGIGDWSTGALQHHEYLEGNVPAGEGEDHKFIEADEYGPARTLKTTTFTVECLMNAYGEKLFVHASDDKDRIWDRYRTGERGQNAYADGSFMATLRCIMEHNVYSAGHLFVERLDGQKGYDLCLDSYAKRAMMRWGLVEVARPYNPDTREPELYRATDLAREFYDKALPHLDKMGKLARYNEIAERMQW